MLACIGYLVPGCGVAARALPRDHGTVLYSGKGDHECVRSIAFSLVSS
jgi:hypothetical protein